MWLLVESFHKVIHKTHYVRVRHCDRIPPKPDYTEEKHKQVEVDPESTVREEAVPGHHPVCQSPQERQQTHTASPPPPSVPGL